MLVVRDPVRRALSDIVHSRITGLVPKNATVESELFSPDGATVDQEHHVISTGYYAFHLKNWLRYFPMEQVWNCSVAIDI